MNDARAISKTQAAGQTASPSDDALVTRLRGVAAVIVAVLVLVGFAVFVAYQVIKETSSSEQSWTRLVYVFGAVEALVFTAFGWLFGREVHREAAKSAETRADSAENRAEVASAEAADQKARGEALRAGIEARANRATTPSGVEERGIGDTPGTAASRDIDELAAFARVLFP